GRRIPRVSGRTLLSEALELMSKINLGALLVVDEKDLLEGIFTDGDLRRCLTRHKKVHQLKIEQVMTRKPKTIAENQLAVEALEIMQKHEVTVLPIVNPAGRLKGVVHLHALLGKGKFRFNSVQSGHD
ncbi:MAG: CBS domain-containing protein, partial [Deltaproteobacteria bacterium]|nr:CBS domain-containing protein [Deltaproteobacteria bacterium]